MGTQRSELIDASRVKRILEELTGDTYVLKTRAELIHPDNKSWYLHLSIGTAGYIGDAYEADDKLVFESPILYDVYHDMEHSFSESKYDRLREEVGSDVGHLHEKDVRQKYRKTLPRVVRFFDKVEETLSKVNQDTHLSLLNFDGSITINAEVETREAERDESAIKRNVLAMMEVLRLMIEWLDEQRD